MRAHGVPNFPDPQTGGGFSIVNTPQGRTVKVNGVAFSGPAYQAAARTCRFTQGGNPPVLEAQRRKLLAFAQCMRRHGFPRWADPRFPAGGGIDGSRNPYSNTTPGVMAAAKICNRVALGQ
jgi:hypothetical protein